MREIKFRAWDEKKKQMFPVICFDWKEQFVIDPQIDCHSLVFTPIMQFTGLKDKNGKEIYEADIVRHTRPDGVYVAEWIEGAAGFALRKSNHTMWLGKLCEPLCEIIGNIHENPELLQPQPLP